MEENLKFKVWWIYLIIAVINIFFFYKFLYSGLSVNGFISTKEIVISLIPFSILILILSIRLKFKIDTKNLSYQYFPFQLKEKIIPVENIESVNFSSFSPIKDHGGWGIRLLNNGWAYTVGGNSGIHIKLKTGEELIIESSFSEKEIEAKLKSFKNE